MTTGEKTQDIETPDAPAIPGLTFRLFRGESDYPLMVAVSDASRAADSIEEVDTVETLARSYSNIRDFEPGRDVVMAEVAGQLVGYRHNIHWEEADGTWILHHYGFLLPEWRGRGLELALVHYCERHLREVTGDYSGSKRQLDSFVADTQTDLEEVLKGEGYEAVRHFYEMVRPDLENIPNVPMPDGLEVRPVQPEQYRTIWEAEVEAFQDHWGAEQVVDEDFQRWQKSNHFQPHLWQVAWDGDQVAGMIRNFIDEDYNARYGKKRGYTENISTRRPWRKRGLASALISRSLQMQKELGLAESALGVDTENPSGALKVYERMGFRAVKRFTVYRKQVG